jgi:hypothetical protein
MALDFHRSILFCLTYSGSRVAVSEAASLKWHFPQENATLPDAKEGT